ncbi:MAG: MFS transporter [candidate division WOR-3 bacterium]|nr:MFS transporter [candidate division WOR-3 bacterium]
MLVERSMKLYSYRWFVLLVFMFIAGMTQLLWITFAPITGKAAQFFNTSDLSVGLLSMCFMVVYILVVLPAAWVIDTYGFRVAVGIGALLTAVFALTRGIFASYYWVVFASQIGIAIGQPFIIGSITKVAARWFPINERATAAGLGTLALYIGILAAMILTPYLAMKYGIQGMLVIYGIVSVAAAITFAAFAREKPPTAPCPRGHEERVLMLDGLKKMLRQKDFILLLIIFFIGLGIFNSVSTWIENIVRPRGFSISQAGMLGGLMLIGGILGAIVMPLFSDKYRKRRTFILVSLIGLTPGLVGMTFFTSYALLLCSGFVFGFFLLSAGPIGFQYGAEITYPAPEGTSNNLLLVMGQISGIVFIFGMDMLKAPGTGSMTASLLMLTGLTIVCIILCTRLKESQLRD